MSQESLKKNIISDKMQLIISSIRSHLKMDIAFISNFAEGGRTIQYVDGDSIYASVLLDAKDPVSKTYCHLIASGQLPNIIPNVALNAQAKQLDVTKKHGIASYIGTPLRGANGDIYGMLCCIGHEVHEALNEKDLALLEVFADLSGVYISEHLAARESYSEIFERTNDVMQSGKLNIAYQPIYDPKVCQIVGYESLARFETTPYSAPDVWFKEAAIVGLGQQLELFAIHRGGEGMKHFDRSVYLSLNISPESLLSGALDNLFDDEISSRVVLEITEHSKVSDYAEFRKALAPLRSKGVRLAVDDAGAGFASFKHILELGADIIKLDRSLIKGIDTDPARSALAAALIAFARETDTKVVAEGVETSEEYKELLRVGVDMVQGYYIGHPMPVEQAKNYQPPID